MKMPLIILVVIVLVVLYGLNTAVVANVANMGQNNFYTQEIKDVRESEDIWCFNRNGLVIAVDFNDPKKVKISIEKEVK